MRWFDVWDVENGDEDGAKPVHAHDPQSAAEEYGDMTYANSDYNSERDINVRDQCGNVTLWTVSAEPSVVFRAVERKAP